jgi:ribonuclease HII
MKEKEAKAEQNKEARQMEAQQLEAWQSGAGQLEAQNKEAQQPEAQQPEARQMEAQQLEARRLAKLGEREAALWATGVRAIAGLDEAGRGCLAGPVVAAAVILKPGLLFPGLNDSKQVSLRNRLRLETEIKAAAAAWGVGLAGPEEIDEYNILEATKLAMIRAIKALPTPPGYLLLDALRLPLSLPQEAVVKGDARIACISAASILAKTHRDRLMEEWDRQYPLYGFRQNKGYPTEAHRRAVIAEGFCPIHRQSFLGFFRRAREERQIQFFGG